jgi:hypothetical protein
VERTIQMVNWGCRRFPVFRLWLRWWTRSVAVQPDRYVQIKWGRPRALPSPCTWRYRRLAGKPGQWTAAVAHRTASVITHPCRYGSLCTLKQQLSFINIIYKSLYVYRRIIVFIVNTLCHNKDNSKY